MCAIVDRSAVGAIDTFSGHGLFRAWLFGIAVRQAGNFYRSSSAKKRGAQLQVPLNGFNDHKDEAKSPAEVSADNDRAAILHRAIDLLPETDRDLVHLHFFGELTFREIAEARMMNPKTVSTRLTRCKEAPRYPRALRPNQIRWMNKTRSRVRRRVAGSRRAARQTVWARGRALSACTAETVLNDFLRGSSQ